MASTRRPVYIRSTTAASWGANKPASSLPGILEEGLINGQLSVTLSQRYELVPVHIDSTLEMVHATSGDILNHLQIPYSTALMSVSSISHQYINTVGETVFA